MKESVFKSSTMGDYVNLRSREKQATMVEQNKVTELPKRNLQKVLNGKEKKMPGLQKKPQKVLPGSVALYLQMRKKQQLEKNNAGEMEKFCNEDPFHHEGSEQNFEQEQENVAQTDTRSPLLEFSPNVKLMEDRRTAESLSIEGEVQVNKEVSMKEKGKCMFFFFSFSI